MAPASKLWPTLDLPHRLARQRRRGIQHTMNHRVTAVIAVVLAAPLSAHAGAPRLAIDEQGARHGQALSAAKICPGARTTTKVAELAAAIPAGDRPAFEAASKKIVGAWDKALTCQDVDPAQAPREFNSCRKSKILSCTSTWREIGPDGAALPGLLDFAPQD